MSDFRLDKYEVTLGRFRAFVDAWVGGWRPSEGQGKHGHLHGGQGLALASGGHEFGWRSEWAKGVPVTKDAWDQALACDTAGSGPPGSGPPGSGPTNDAARRDKLPVRCVTWTEAMAFCLWDGGFLPSEAEWSYAAGGGSEQRTYPWLVSGRVPLGVSKNLAVYDATSAEVVGSRPEGAGRWGQLDLAGNASEWTADGDGAYPQPCIDCVNGAEAGGARVVRGGSFRSPAGELLATFRSSAPLMERSRTLGLRCSRGPEGKATGSDGGTDAGKERVGGGRDGG